MAVQKSLAVIVKVVTSNFKWKIFSNFVPFSKSPNFNDYNIICIFLQKDDIMLHFTRKGSSDVTVA